MARIERSESPNTFPTPELWGQGLIQALRPIFKEVGYDLPDISTAFGAFPYLGGKSKRVAEAWSAKSSADGKPRIIVNTRNDDTAVIVRMVAKCCCHIMAPEGSGHGPAFRKIAETIGFTGSMRDPTPNHWFGDRLSAVRTALGPLPDVRLDADRFRAEGDIRPEGAPKKQTGRLLKAVCDGCIDQTGAVVHCAYSVRLTRKWATDYGATCPKHGPMRVLQPDDADGAEHKSEPPAPQETTTSAPSPPRMLNSPSHG